MLLNRQRAFSALKATAHKKESALNEMTRKHFSAKLAGKKLMRTKTPEANLKFSYRKALEVSLAATLVLLLLLSHLARQLTFAAQRTDNVDIQIEVADIPPTEQFHRPPPPPRPSIPLPTESEDVPVDVTIATTELDLSDLPPPPEPPEEGELPIFIAYDEPPRIIGGISALMKHLHYPRLAQASGVEGVVFVKVLVTATGVTERTEILKAKPANIGFEEAAMRALKKVKWHPARQRDKKIRVWVSIPVQFKLVSS